MSSIHGRIGLCDVGGFPESDGFSGKTRRKEKREEEIRVLFVVLVVKRKGRVVFQVYEAFCIFSSIHGDSGRESEHPFITLFYEFNNIYF